MEADLSIASLIVGASLLVKLVMLLLLAASVASWAMIYAKRKQLLAARRDVVRFEDQFRANENLTALYNRVSKHLERGASGMEKLFAAGFREFARLHNQAGLQPMDVLSGSERAMRVAAAREMESLEGGLAFLATVGSVSPYIGLFGTVWGIMNSFQALGNVHQATLAMVAPGISEALVATAMGLFAAIPAVIAYNRFSADIDRITGRYDIFVEEFVSILQRQARTEGAGS
ncbi:MAG: protein TolQ [Pseudomonadota bacterium]